MSFWTDERVALLRRGLAEGLSAAATAVLLHCTRNAAIGKAKRLKIKFLPKDGGMMRYATKDQAERLGANLQPETPFGTLPSKLAAERPDRQGPKDLVLLFDDSIGGHRASDDYWKRRMGGALEGRRDRGRYYGYGVPLPYRSPPKPKAPVQEPIPTPWDRLEIVNAGVPIWELKDNQCRAVLGETLNTETLRYCGKPTVKHGSWCAAHHKAYCRTVSQIRAEQQAEKDLKRVGRWS